MAKAPEMTIKVEIDIKPQLCPKCGGNKYIQVVTGTTINYNKCDVCDSKGIVWPPKDLISAIKEGKK